MEVDDGFALAAGVDDGADVVDVVLLADEAGGRAGARGVGSDIERLLGPKGSSGCAGVPRAREGAADRRLRAPYRGSASSRTAIPSRAGEGAR